MKKSGFKYHAFISYSQDPDKLLALELETRLEKFGLGWHRLKKQQIYIFRDVTDLTPTGDLGGKIKEGLEHSEYLILLAQKKLSTSALNWVNQETEYFIEVCKRRKVDPTDFIILVITDGFIEWDSSSNSWNFEKTNVIPQVLRNAFVSQPLYVDLRGLHSSISRTEKKQLFDNAFIVIAAKLLGKKPGEIQNMVIQLQRVVIGIVAAIAIVMLGLSIFSAIQRNKATHEKNNAIIARKAEEVQKKLAIDRQLEAERATKEAKRQELKADSSRYEADTARIEAVEQRIIADANKIQALIARDSAESAKKEAEVRRYEAETAKSQTDTLNQLLIAENLSITYTNLFSKAIEPTEMAITYAYTDSVLKAASQFNKYFIKTRTTHYNKMESIYTAVQLAFKQNMHSELKLARNYSRLFVTGDHNVYLLNGDGNICHFNSVRNTVDSALVFSELKGAFEITPVTGSDIILYSYHKDEWKALDIGKNKIIPILNKNADSHSVVNSAQLTGKDQSFALADKKGNILYLAISNNGQLTIEKSIKQDKNIISFSEGPNGFFRLAENGELSAIPACVGCQELKFEKVSSFSANQDADNIYIGFIDGTINSYNQGVNKTSVINRFDNRINRILWANKCKTLIVQEGFNKLILYQKMDNIYVRLFESLFGQNINDLTLDSDGRLYVLYDKSRLQWWDIDQVSMISSIEKVQKTMVLK